MENKVSISIKQHISHIAVEGDIFAVTTAELKNAFEESWQRKVFKIILNLENSKLINSSGIGVIVGALKTCRDSSSSGDLVILNPPSYVKRTMRIMGLDKFVPTKENEQEAIDYLQSKKGADEDTPFF